MFSEHIIGKLLAAPAFFILLDLYGVSFKLRSNAYIGVKFMIIGLITSLFGLRKLILQFFKFNFKRLSFFNLCTQRPCLIKVEIDFVSFVILSETVVIILFAAHFFIAIPPCGKAAICCLSRRIKNRSSF